VIRIGIVRPLAVAALFAAPIFMDRYTAHVAVLALIFAIVAVGLSLVMGFAGQVNLAQAAFFGAAAYSASILTTQEHWSPWAAAPVAIAVAMAVAVVCGLPALRVQSHYLGIVSLGLAVAFSSLLTNSGFTGGASGIFGVPPIELPGVDMTDNYNFYYLALAALLAVGAFALFVASTTLGRRLEAMRDDTLAAAACGIEIPYYRLAAFVLAGLCAGVAGVLYAHFVRYVSPDTFSLNAMFLLLAMVIIGGQDSIWASAVGAILLMTARNLLSGIQAYQQLVYGALIVATVVFAPRGLGGTADLVARRLGIRLPRLPLPLPIPRLAAPAPQPVPARREAVGGTALEVVGVGKRFRGLSALSNVTLEVAEGEIHGIIGPNGSGKTTLFNVVSGIYRPSGGTVRLRGRDVTRRRSHQLARWGMGRTFQNLRLFRRLTVLENVMVALDRDPVWAHLRYVVAPWSVWSRERRRRAQGLELLRGMGLDDVADVEAVNLPYGRQRQLEIARAVAGDADLLLLDEPAAGLNAAEMEVLKSTIRQVRDAGVTVVLIEHNMGLVMSLCERVTVLAHGQVIASGSPVDVSTDQAVIEAYLGAAFEGSEAV
jgi:branched-chain amino acid transport system permease protein